MLVVLQQIEITLNELVHLQLEGDKWVVHRWVRESGVRAGAASSVLALAACLLAL